MNERDADRSSVVEQRQVSRAGQVVVAGALTLSVMGCAPLHKLWGGANDDKKTARVTASAPEVAPKDLRGVYAFTRFEDGQQTRQIQSLFDAGELEVIWLRWLWSFTEERSVTTQLQFLIRAEKNSYYACDAVLSTDVVWRGDTLEFPVTVRARGVVVTMDGEFAIEGGQFKYNYSKRKRNCGVRISRGKHLLQRRARGFSLCATDRPGECMIFEPSTFTVDYEQKVLDHAREELLRPASPLKP